MVIQNVLGKAVTDKIQEDLEKLEEHTKKIKIKIESGKVIDKSIIDKEAIKELNHKEAHEKAKVVKKIDHKVLIPKEGDWIGHYGTIIADLKTIDVQDIKNIQSCVASQAHVYLICSLDQVAQLKALLYHIAMPVLELIHTFKYSSISYSPKIGFKCHYEYILYINVGNKPVNHLLPNVIESTYAKDSRNLGLYTNLLLRSANAGDTILGINITNGNLIKAAQAMLCSTVIIPADNIAMRECEKTIKELQFK